MSSPSHLPTRSLALQHRVPTPDTAAQTATDVDSIDVDLSELEVVEDSPSATKSHEPELPKGVWAAFTSPFKKQEKSGPSLTRMQMIGAGKVLSLVPATQEIKVDGRLVTDHKRAIAIYEGSVDKEGRTWAGKAVDRLVYKLTNKAPKSAEDVALDKEALKMKHAVVRFIAWGQEKAAAINTWIRSGRIGTWLDKYKKADPTLVRSTSDVELVLKNGTKVHFPEEIEDEKMSLVLQRVAMVSTSALMVPAPPGVGQVITGLVAGGSWLSAAGVGIKTGLAHLGVGSLENSGGWPLASALLALGAEQIPLAIPFAPPILPPVLIEVHAGNVNRLSGEKAAVAVDGENNLSIEEEALAMKPGLTRAAAWLKNKL